MKKITLLSVAAFLTFTLVAFPVFAARETVDKPDLAASMSQGALRLSQMMDRTVKDRDGNDLGQIEDVVFDDQGRAVYGILAGPSNKYYPIPLQTLVQNVREDDFVLNISKDRIDAAPSFSRGDWPKQLSGADWEQKVFSYYGTPSPSGTMTQPPADQPSTGTATPPRGQ